MVILIFGIGAIFGSFFYCFGTRRAEEKNAISGRSICPNCEYTLKWFNLIPLFSYILQLGKCSSCKNRISIVYFVVEIITGTLFSYLFLRYNFSYEFFVGIILASTLVLISITDFKYFIILDELIIVSSILIIVSNFIFKSMNYTLMSIVNGIVLFLIMFGIKILGDFLFKKESLGGGDIKLAFLIGLSVGFKLSLIVLILSTFLALPASFFASIKNEHKYIPYGPFLAGALLIVFLFVDKFNIIFI